jgi:DNA polymerase-1
MSIGGFKDISELHIATVEQGKPEMFETVLKAAMYEADVLFDSSDPLHPESDPNKDFPTYTVREIKEMQDEEDEDGGWFCPMFMKAGDITIFGGASKKSGKTTFYAHMLKCVHDGKAFMGMPTTKQGALILTEQGTNILEATAKAGIGEDYNIHFAFYRDISRHTWPKLIEKAVERCKELGVKILVIDTMTSFAKLRGSSENWSGEIIERMEPVLDAARVHGIHVSVIHHTGKDGELRGSTAWIKDPDAVWILKRPPGEHGPNVRTLEGFGRYDDINTTFNVALDGGAYVRLGSNAQIEHALATEGILKETPYGEENARRKTQIIAVVSEHVNVSEATIKRAFQTAEDKGLLRSKKLREQGSPQVVWKRTKGEPKDSEGLFRSDTEGKGPDETNKRIDPASVIEDSAALQEFIRDIEPRDPLALDIETMPPPEWKQEAFEEYRAWRAALKNKAPKLAQRKKRLDKIKEKIYKDYAVNTDTARPRLISLAASLGEGSTNVVVDVTKVNVAPLLEVLRDKTLITHNGTFDLGVLRTNYGYIHRGRLRDTQHLYTLHHYAEAGERTKKANGMWRLPDPRDTKVEVPGVGKVGMTSLAHVAHKYLDVRLDKDAQTSDWSRPRLSEKQLRYALEDTRILPALADELIAALHGVGMSEIVDLEERAFPATADMSLNGFPADTTGAMAMAEKYRKESEAKYETLEALMPEPPEDAWNLNADADIRTILRTLGANLDKKAYPKTESTKEPRTAESALRTIKKPQAAVDWVDAYLAYKNLAKHHKDFAKSYVGLIREDGTLRGSYDTVSTGRLSCRKPNLQQVPARGKLQKEEGMRIRDIFRAPEGHKFIIADFSQVELLLAATIAARETGEHGHMFEVFQKAEVDIHRATAAFLLGKDPEAVTKAERTMAKAVNFGLIYGAQAETLLETARNSYGVTDMTLSDAKAYRRGFFELYPELASWHSIVEKQCKDGVGFALTPLGRRRKLPKWIYPEEIAHTTAKNAPVQGAGADAIKLTMAKLFEDREHCPGSPRLRASVHDEVVLTVEEDHVEAAVEWVRTHMAAAEREAVGDPESPIVVEIDPVDSWGEG